MFRADYKMGVRSAMDPEVSTKLWLLTATSQHYVSTKFSEEKRLKGTDEESNSQPLNCSIALYQYGHLVHRMMKTLKCYCKLFLLTCHLMAEVSLICLAGPGCSGL